MDVPLIGGTALNAVYIVVGNTGEYSSWTTWNVASYTTKEQADIHCNTLNDLVKGSKEWDYDKRDEFKISLDPLMEMQYGGTEYSVEEVSLFAHFDQFQESLL